MMELLAPAGSMEALHAAVCSGADAVYLGFTSFGARATAANFDEESLSEAISYCHAHHVRVYVTVNTLVKEAELENVYRVGELLTRLRADAALVQDLGVASLFHRSFPSLPLHASTQMAIHNPQGVEQALAMGLERVVLARECSLDTIRACCDTGAQIEVFVHGAQCVSMSGECLFSSMVGGRSGNRGRCAQPCRLDYEFDGKRGAWLSPRDVMLRDDLPALQAAGVASLKIEGRLKRPEYVSVVTSAYRHALDSLRNGSFSAASETEREALLQIFNRGGFSRGYSMGTQDAGTIDISRVNHLGLPMGEVLSSNDRIATIRLKRPLHNGDALQFRGNGDRDLIYSGPEVEAGQLATVRLRPGLKAYKGEPVARLTDALQVSEASKLIEKRYPVSMSLSFVPGELASLTASDGTSTVTCCGEPVSVAQSRPVTAEDARHIMEKTGDTIFTLSNFSMTGENGFLPVSALNRLRRETLEALTAKRTEAFAQPVLESVPFSKSAIHGHPYPHFCVESAYLSVGEKTIENGGTFIYTPEDYTSLTADGIPGGTYLKLPPQLTGKTLENLLALVRSVDGIGIVADNPGMPDALHGIPFGCGYGVPVTNRETVSALLQNGAEFITVSPELNEREIRALPLENAPFLLPVYGRTRLMVLNHCPARTALGLKSGRNQCKLCDKNDPHSLKNKPLTDRLDAVFPMKRTRLPEGCLISLYNSVPTNITVAAKKFPAAPLLSFTVEEEAEQLRLLEMFLSRGEIMLDTPSTSGHFRRGVE